MEHKRFHITAEVAEFIGIPKELYDFMHENENVIEYTLLGFNSNDSGAGWCKATIELGFLNKLYARPLRFKMYIHIQDNKKEYYLEPELGGSTDEEFYAVTGLSRPSQTFPASALEMKEYVQDVVKRYYARYPLQ